MAYGTTGGVSAAPAKPAPSPEDHRPQFAQPQEPPHPTLRAVGFNGGIQQFNQRVASVTQAFQQAHGHKPPPGLVLDVARSPVPDTHFDRLFQNPISARFTQYMGQHPDDPNETLLKGLRDALKQGSYQDFYRQHLVDINNAVQDDDSFRRKLTAVQLAADRRDVNRAYQGGNGEVLRAISLAAGVAAKAGGQIAFGLTFGPASFGYEEYKGASKSITDRSLTPLAEENVKLAKGVARGVKQDVQDPLDNSGFLFLDALGFASAGGGALARAGAAGRAAARGEGVAAVARAAVKRPLPGTATLRKGDLEVEMPLSGNATVRAAQKLLVAYRNRRMRLRHEGDYPGGVLSVVRPQLAQDVLDRVLDPVRGQFSSENKIGRELRAQKRVDHVVQMTVKRELDHAAGWSSAAAPVFGRIIQKLPEVARRGLTVGEQKAIQILVTDDPDPAALHREFHQKMIEWGIGDPEAHRGQLAAIKLAEKALADPSRRFRRALDLTREVLAEQEQLKIQELGLSPETAGRRVVNAAEVLRGQNISETAGGPEYGGQYLKYESKRKPTRRPGERLPGNRQGAYGIPKPSDLPELTHVFTGDSIRAGDFRIDATNLAGESYARAVRLATIRNEHANLWKAATDKPRSPFDRPIRDIRDVPDKLREAVARIDEGDFVSKELDGLGKDDIDSLFKLLYPGRLNDRTGRWQLEEPVPNVKWVDSRLLDVERSPIPTAVKKVAQTANEPFRIAALYVRPAYILNAVGNTGMILMDEGHLAVPNVARAIFAKKLYGEKVTRTIDALVGQGRSRSYVAGEVDSLLTRGGRGLAEAWNLVADLAFRRASLIHYLRQNGFKTREQIDGLLHGADAAKRAEIVRRANKAMVEFDNLTWWEQNVLKHVVFVYPWVSRSLVWSLRTIMEHPIKTDVLAQIGGEEEQEHPEIFKRVPEWFKRTGYIPVGYDDQGNPKVINPTSVNTFTTLTSLMGTAGEAFGNARYSPTEELFGPAGKFAVHAFSGRDEFGNEYPGPDWWGAAKQVLLGLPQVSAYERAQRKNAEIKPTDLANRRTLVEKLHGNLKRTVFSPGWLDGYGALITGGLSTRTVDLGALQARYWADKPIEERHRYELTLVREALKMQAGLLDSKVPRTVGDAVTFATDRDLAYLKEQKQLGRNPTQTEQAQIDISLLEKQGRIGPEDAAALNKRLKGIHDPTELGRFRDGLADKYMGAKDLRQWDSDVRFVASFTPKILDDKLRALGDLTGVKRVTADQETLYKAGREALAYVKHARELKKQVDALSDPAAQAVKLAEIRAWQDEHDKPIRINGHTVLPSPVRLAWANQTDREKHDHIATVVNHGWDTLSNFDKELVGKKVSPATSEGWLAITKAKDAYHRQFPGKQIDKDQLRALAKQVDKTYPGFYKDFVFAEQPRILRLEVLKPFQGWAPDTKQEFDRYIARPAKQLSSAIASGNYDNSQLREAWRGYAEQVNAWLQEPAQKNLRARLEPFGSKFVYSLIER